MIDRKGLFITLEGPDGSGKTTNLPFIKEIFETKGYTVFTHRDPGGSIVSEEIRNLTLQKRDTEVICPDTTLLLFTAARAQLIHSKIIPELKNPNHVVICDRFIDSTYAYQGYGDGLLEKVIQLEKMFYLDCIPDFTLFFTIDFETSIERIKNRNKEYNRLNEMDIEFRKRTFRGYRQRFITNLNRMRMIESDKPIEVVQSQITETIDQIMKLKEI